MTTVLQPSQELIPRAMTKITYLANQPRLSTAAEQQNLALNSLRLSQFVLSLTQLN